MNNDWSKAFTPTAECVELDEMVARMEGRRGPIAQRKTETHVAACAHCSTELAMFKEFESAQPTPEEKPHVQAIVARLKQNSPVAVPSALTAPSPAAVPSPITIPSNAIIPSNIAVPSPAAIPSRVAVPAPAAIPSRVAVPSPAAIPSRVAVPSPVAPAILSPVPTPWWKTLWNWKFLAPATIALASAALLLTIWNPPSHRPTPDFTGQVSVYRSTKIVTLSPTAEIHKSPSAFSWQPVAGAASYRIRVFEVDNTELWSTIVTAPTANLPVSISDRLVAPKTIHWQVVALNASGAVIGDSGTQTSAIR